MYEPYSLSKTKVALSIIALIAVCVGYDHFFVNRVSAEDTGVPTLTVESLSIINKIEGLKLDANFLTDPVFNSLINYRVDVPVDTNPGRPNPFLPAPRGSNRGR